MGADRMGERPDPRCGCEPGIVLDQPTTPDETPKEAPLAPDSPAPDPYLVRVQADAARLRVVARVLGGAEVTSAPDAGAGVEASAPLVGDLEL